MKNGCFVAALAGLGVCVVAPPSEAFYRMTHPGVCNPSYYYIDPHDPASGYNPTSFRYNSEGLSNGLAAHQGFSCPVESDGDLPYWNISYFVAHGMDKPGSGTFFQRCVMTYYGYQECGGTIPPNAAVPGVNTSYVLSIGGGTPWTTFPTEGAYIYVKLAPTAKVQHFEFNG